MLRTAVTLLLTAAILTPADLPVRRVVLYKHGVGYFERAGDLAGGESARLEFKATEMNDVLKSLTVEERGGGRITGLRYDSMDPLGRKLGEFPFKLADQAPLSAVLDQLKGARVELKFGTETVAGAIVSGRLVPGDDKRPEREQVALLTDAGDMRTVDLSAASQVRFPDPQLQQQFRDYLAALTASRSKERRSVYIDSTDAKSRSIVASYMIPAAVWKSSYRLIFPATGAPMLEGWAIVDNTTAEDWTKVRLALVSGRPISFVSQLYAPKYVDRPAGDLPDEFAAGPVVHEGGYAMGGVIGGIAGAAPSAAPPPPPAMAKKRPIQVLEDRLMNTADAEYLRKDTASTLALNVAGRELGDLFEYSLAQPVTIRKNESAMLPFLQQTIDARKLLIYSRATGEHPMNAAELSNSTAKTLDGGPITLYDNSAYAGEALMATLKAGDKRLISYAVDLGTRVSEAFDNRNEVERDIHARRGVITTRTAVEEVRTYTIRNVDARAKTLVIEHPLRPGYKLLEPKGGEKTSQAYRFEVKLVSAGEVKFPVAEERVLENSTMVSNLTPGDIIVYARNKNLPAAARRQLEVIADRKTQLTETQRAAEGAAERVRNLTADEERLRLNIQNLNSVSGQQQQVQTYATQLAAMETQLAQTRDQQSELQKKRATLESEIARLVTALEF